MNKVCFCSIDVEPDFAREGFQGVENLDKILDILQKHNLSATLFVSGEVIKRYPALVRAWAKNFEIACHSFNHQFWPELSAEQREQQLDSFIKVYQGLTLVKLLKGFRAPSHLIDTDGLKLIESKGFLYDSSVLPHYPFFKKYRGYKGKTPTSPFWQSEKLLEIPVSGQIFGIPLVGTWISKLPLSFYRILFTISKPNFLTLNFHSWDSLDLKLLTKADKILKLLKKSYLFLRGEQVYEKFSKNRR